VVIAVMVFVSVSAGKRAQSDAQRRGVDATPPSGAPPTAVAPTSVPPTSAAPQSESSR
jgi:hypothetical protein